MPGRICKINGKKPTTMCINMQQRVQITPVGKLILIDTVWRVCSPSTTGTVLMHSNVHVDINDDPEQGVNGESHTQASPFPQCVRVSKVSTTLMNMCSCIGEGTPTCMYTPERVQA